MFGIRAKFLYDKLDFVMKMIEEILNTSRLDDEKRIHEIIASMKSGLQNRLSSAGNATAVMRAASYYSPMSNFPGPHRRHRLLPALKRSGRELR